MIYIIDDDEIMANCVARACEQIDTVKVFSDGIAAIQALDEELPQLIFLDIMLVGPDGFTFLNELASYADTSQVPVVIITSLDLAKQDLSAYGVVGILDKSVMLPQEIEDYARKYCQ